MSDLPTLAPGKSWWAGLADIHKSSPTERMEDGADGAYCWVMVPAADEEEATAAIMNAAKEEGLVVEGVEDLQVVASLDEISELDENLAEVAETLTSTDGSAWGTLNLYEAEAA